MCISGKSYDYLYIHGPSSILKVDSMSMYILFQSLRGSKRPPVAVPEKKPATQASQMSNELFQKLKRRRGQQGEGTV